MTLCARTLAIKERHAETKNRRLTLANKAGVGMELVNRSGNLWAMLLPDASTPGHYRYQVFDKRGFCSHHTRKTLAECFNEAFDAGFTEETNGMLDKLSQDDEWARGLIMDSIRNDYHNQKITFAEMLGQLNSVDIADKNL